MIIPIQREGVTTATTTTTPSTSSQRNHNGQSILKTTTITPTVETKSSKSYHSEHTTSTNKLSPSWDEFSALKMFEDNNKRWVRDDIEQFLLPVPMISTQKSLMKEKFDNFRNQIMLTPMMQEHPIKIDTFVTESDKYVLTLNVQQFKPEELHVKITDDMINITGKHEEKKDEMNFSCQEYSRKHSLPPGVKADDVKCSMSTNGVLTISAPRKIQPALMDSERTIPIQYNGLPGIRV